MWPWHTTSRHGSKDPASAVARVRLQEGVPTSNFSPGVADDEVWELHLTVGRHLVEEM
jgi:hypothetical protein